MSTAPRLTIDLSALVHNWRFMKQKSGNAEAAAVVKADAYGLGIEPVVDALSKAGCKTFFTAMMEEAIRVRKISPDARVIVLNGVVAETVKTATEQSIIPVLSSIEQTAMWKEHGGGHPSVLHVDTGMNRLGLRMQEAEALSANPELLGSINPVMLMSHLACADEPNDPKNIQQLETFLQTAEQFPGLPTCFANSAGIMLGADYHFSTTRPGIALYGAEAVNNVPNPMKPVVTAEARILQIRRAEKGETIGYGAEQRLDRETKVAVCSGGYADGYHRSASGAGVTLRKDGSAGAMGAIAGHRVPVLGRVSMDLTTFDVTDVPQQVLDENQWLELFGNTIPVDDLARACGTIGYELLTSLGNRYHREYRGG